MKKIGNKGMIGILSTERNNFSWQFIQSLLQLKSVMGSSVGITYAHSGTIPDGRNAVLQAAKQGRCDYALMIDSDMTFPSDGISMLKASMEKFDADIGCGIYFGTYPPFSSAPLAFDEKDGVQVRLDSWEKTRYITTCGMGFTLITKDLFDIKFEFQPGKGEDHLFCKEAQKLGAKAILEPAVKCGHLRTIAIDEEIIKKLGL